MKRVVVGAALLLLAGCAYYNGMYNTKRLAHMAEKAEREGRSFDAANYWGQVAVKAESVSVKHPDARWSDEARYLRGTALVKLNDCPNGLKVLEPLLTTAHDEEIREGAAFLVGGCRMHLGDAEGATEAYARLLGSHDAARRSVALYAHGRALRQAGRFEAALPELSASTQPGARGERAAALAALGRLSEALPLADSVLAEKDTAAPWPALAGATAEHDPHAASSLVDRLVASPAIPASLRARLLLDDGVRWLATDAARGETRLRQADSAARGTPVRGEVHTVQARLLIGRMASTADLRAAILRLQDFEDDGESGSSAAGGLAALSRRILQVIDSTPAGAPTGDLRLFLVGEVVRDSLGAPGLAAELFRRVVAEWSGSPYAGKAMLALIALDPGASDSLREVLRTHYPDNPYVALAQGGDSPDYAVLEDSLRRLAFTLLLEPRRSVYPSSTSPSPPPGQPLQPGQPSRPRAPQPAMPRQPVDQ